MIDIDLEKALRRPGTRFQFSWTGDPGFENIDLAAPVQVDCTYSVSGSDVRVAGSVRGQLRVPCSRCLEPVLWQTDADFEEVFSASPRDGGEYAYNRETKRISLDQMIYDILSVDIPLQVLCSDTCRGLCPQCGRNLNEGPCECHPEDDHAISPNNPFAELKDLF